jgi:hypothetical protein
MISDNYSEDFAASSDNGSEGKNTLIESKNKLQNKAQSIITESKAYSDEEFETESIGQSIGQS